jgi:hypothetical protein
MVVKEYTQEECEMYFVQYGKQTGGEACIKDME